MAGEEGHTGVRSAKRESRGRSTEAKAGDGRSQTEHKMGGENAITEGEMMCVCKCSCLVCKEKGSRWNVQAKICVHMCICAATTLHVHF